MVAAQVVDGFDFRPGHAENFHRHTGGPIMTPAPAYAVHLSVDGQHVTVRIPTQNRQQACNAAWLAAAQSHPDARRVNFTRVVREG